MLGFWFLYALFVSAIITLLPLEILKNATSVEPTALLPGSNLPENSIASLRVLRHDDVLVNQSRFTAQKPDLRLLQDQHQESSYQTDEGKTGFDLSSVGMVVLLQCIVVSVETSINHPTIVSLVRFVT